MDACPNDQDQDRVPVAVLTRWRCDRPWCSMNRTDDRDARCLIFDGAFSTTIQTVVRSSIRRQSFKKKLMLGIVHGP
jgi:hypothetical protein